MHGFFFLIYAVVSFFSLELSNAFHPGVLYEDGQWLLLKVIAYLGFRFVYQMYLVDWSVGYLDKTDPASNVYGTNPR